MGEPEINNNNDHKQEDNLKNKSEEWNSFWNKKNKDYHNKKTEKVEEYKDEAPGQFTGYVELFKRLFSKD